MGAERLGVTPKGSHLSLPFDTPSPAYVLARDGNWALVWLPRRDQLLWADLSILPFESLQSPEDHDVTP